MRNFLTKIALIFLLPIALLGSTPSKTSETPLPEEMFVLKIPNEEKDRWERRLLTACQYLGCVFMTPKGQDNRSDTKPTETLVINFNGLENTHMMTVDEALADWHKKMVQLYPGAKVLTNVIKKTETDLLVEFSSAGSEPLFYNIERYHVVPSGAHMIAFICTNCKLSKKRKNRWLKAIQDEASIKKLEEIPAGDPQLVSFRP